MLAVSDPAETWKLEDVLEIHVTKHKWSFLPPREPASKGAWMALPSLGSRRGVTVALREQG